MPNLVFCQELFLLISQRPGFFPAFFQAFAAVRRREWAGAALGRNNLVGAVKHQPRNIFHGQPCRQIFSPFSCAESPVLIRNQLSGSQEILERMSVHCQNIHFASVGHPQIFAFFIPNQTITIHLLFFPQFFHAFSFHIIAV